MEIGFQQIFIPRENHIGICMDRGAENRAVVCVANPFFGGISRCGDGSNINMDTARKVSSA